MHVELSSVSKISVEWSYISLHAADEALNLIVAPRLASQVMARS
jgi:hypothetical protein